MNCTDCVTRGLDNILREISIIKGGMYPSVLCYTRFKVVCRSPGGSIKVSMKRLILFLVWVTLVKDGKSS